MGTLARHVAKRSVSQAICSMHVARGVMDCAIENSEKPPHVTLSNHRLKLLKNFPIRVYEPISEVTVHYNANGDVHLTSDLAARTKPNPTIDYCTGIPVHPSQTADPPHPQYIQLHTYCI